MNINKKILIVDDTENLRETMKDIFIESGFRYVITASDGKEGIETARKELPDLILMDLMMPNMTGGEAVLELQANANTKDIPVIFITGVLTKDDEGKASVNVNGKFYPSIGKPFNPKILLRRIDEYLS